MELTDACNLRCKHCLRKQARPAQYIPIAVIRTLIAQARPFGITEVGLTGGEPTQHPQFKEIVNTFSRAGYAITLFTNGADFGRAYKIISGARNNLREVRLSLDGAQAETHDKNRGKGSYAQVIEAAKICRSAGLAFSLNTVISQLNKSELAALARLAGELGSRAIFFSHLQLTGRPLSHSLALSPQERLRAERAVRNLQKQSSAGKIYLCAGAYAQNPVLLCPVPLGSFYADCKGNIAFCAMLSSLDLPLNGSQLISNLRETTLAAARRKLLQRYALFAHDRMRDFFSRRLKLADHFPCDWCLKYFKKTNA